MNPDNYGTREACRRLVKAGIVLKTEFYWQRELFGWTLVKSFSDIPAPSVAEVWRELPKSYRKDEWLTFPRLTQVAGATFASYYSHNGEPRVFKEENPTDASIDLLLWVRREKKDGK